MFEKKMCSFCGIGLEEQTSVKNSGKLFCSEAHAQEHVKRSEGGHGCY